MPIRRQVEAKVLDFTPVDTDLRWFMNQYGARACSGCEAEILHGEMMALDNGEPVGQACCYDGTPPVQRGVCPRCFMELPSSRVCGTC